MIVICTEGGIILKNGIAVGIIVMLVGVSIPSTGMVLEKPSLPTSYVGNISDDYSALTPPTDSGRYSGQWLEQAKLNASDGAPDDWFGLSVSLDGEHALIGACSKKGSAYVFKRDGTTWIQQDELTASDGENGDSFGRSVSLDGEYALIGAWGDDGDKGSAYVFVHNPPPSVEFVNPREGYLHFSGRPLLPTTLNLLADTVSFGGFRLRPIQVNATDDNSETGELIVTLFINEEDKGYGIWNPDTGYYEWEWTGWALGTYWLKVKAKDIYGAESEVTLEIWNFCMFP